MSSGEELDSGAIKDKAAKISYLDKLVALVGICSGHDINVRPSKVVAGLEPKGTNALLSVSFFVVVVVVFLISIVSSGLRCARQATVVQAENTSGRYRPV